MDIADLVGAFSEKFGVFFRPASPGEIAAAEAAGVPESLLAFYREFEPNEAGKERIRFFPLERVVAEMTDFVPGCHLSRHGFVALAGTDCGDVFFVRPARGRDYRKMPVFLFSHDIDYSSMPGPQIEEFGVVVAEGIPDFLQKSVAGSLEIDPFHA